MAIPGHSPMNQKNYSRISTLWPRYWQRSDGAATVEFALVAGVLIFMVLGIFELGLIMLISSGLEGSAHKAARYGMTGQGSSVSSEEREGQILEVATNSLPGFLDPEKLDVNIVSYKEFQHIGKAEPYEDRNGNGKYDPGDTYGDSFTDLNGNGKWDKDSGLPGAGSAGSVTVYELHYPWSVMTPLFNNFVTDGVLDLSTRIVVKNEQYD